ncbi:MAG: 3-oxoacyl-ACP synthase [Bacteroidetes bacterium]|nr:3-oxoacyl-ACP synthase [Bacteroidota bacterium]HET6244622.1 3-oxoacyl-ACP synthase [Bacteroidia bacterium]
MFSIKRYSSINNNMVHQNGHLLFDLPSFSFEEFSDEIYRIYKIAYPKYHKMDNLSKLGFLTSEVLLKEMPLKEIYDENKIGIVLSNKNSSLDTDIKYNNLVKKGIASPAIFVYSLPNIVIGEICIKNGIKGENTFFVSNSYDIPSQVDYVGSLLKAGIVDACICGWIEILEGSYKSFLFLVDSHEQKELIPFTVKNVELLYNTL